MRTLSIVLAASLAVSSAACGGMLVPRDPAAGQAEPTAQGANAQGDDPSSPTSSASSASSGSGASGASGASKTSTTTTTAAPATSSHVSVTVRSQCSKTVRVFFGQKPKFGSGRTSSVSSNSVSSESFNTGDMMWIVDESDNGLASTTVSSSTHEITVGADCHTLSAH
ncbi:MAG: hypothetical protein JWM74_865 [Myxococcaceae bacterium]|nr:hypothetical protein [Myxococcaceae bacterium]